MLRRDFLLSLLGLGIAGVSYAEPVDVLQKPLVGAIRWDAWYAPESIPTKAVERALTPPQYRSRLPFFADENGDASDVRLPPLSQEVMDLEIRQAAFAGLDFWSFVAFDRKNTMSIALDLYLQSKYRDRIRFCMFTALEYWGASTQPSSLASEHLKLMKNPSYVRFDGRPLYFLGFVSGEKIRRLWGGVDPLKDAIGQFRAAAIAYGLANPYLVMAGSPSDAELWTSLGADAASAYAISDTRHFGTYRELTHVAEDGWRKMALAHLPVIPTVMAGWDRRPRIERPVPWESWQKPNVGMEAWFAAPSRSELAQHLGRAIDFANSQTPRRAPAVIIYAWNENDEGGWLIPTLPCNTDHLYAVREATKALPAQDPGCDRGK
jgi:hypothetical protein